MTDQTTERRDWVRLILLVGFLAVLAVVTAVLLSLLPACGALIAVLAGCLAIGVPAFVVGLEWGSPDWPTKGPRSVRTLIPVGVSLKFLVDATSAMRSHDWPDLRFDVPFTAVALAAIYVPFLLGRAISRRRARTRQEDTPNG